MKTIKNLTADEIRKSILQLAIQGKLVKQDPSDEPASELVKRIYAEKEKLIKEGKIKKDRNESYIYKGDDNCYYEKIGNNEPVKLEDLPFDIPDSWTWIRLNSISTISAGGTPDRGNPKYWNGSIPWLKISDITSSNKYVNKSSEFITEEGMNNSSAKLMTRGTILYTIFATIGKVGILDFEATCNQAIAGISTYLKSIDEYLYLLLVNLQDYMKSISKGCAQFNINQKILKETIVALPPLNEQTRIVNKINSCELLIEQYSAAEEKLSKIEQEFPEKLKKSILQYAIEGKLVKQDPNEEPASVLLERIKTEKEKLIKEGKIKRDKNESYIYQGDDKNYYENLPKNWTISCLKNICLSINAGGDKPKNITKEKTKDNIYPVIANGVQNNGIVGYCPFYEINEVCLTISGRGTIGFPIIRNYPFTPIVRLLVVRPMTNFVNIDFLSYLLSLKIRKGVGTSIQQLTVPMIVDLPVEIPPQNEQVRIISKINAIFKEII